MKKITFLLGIGLMTFSLSGQSLTETSTESNPTFERNSQDVLWHQEITGTSGIVSDFFMGLSAGVYSADDFEITESFEITHITTIGFQNNANLETILLGYQLFIYADSNGSPEGSPSIPGSAIVELDLGYPHPALTLDASVAYAFTVDIAEALGESLTLPAGIYWVSAAPVLDMSSLDGPTRWNWYNGEENLSAAMLIDPADLFEGGFTWWTPIPSLVTPPWGGLAFTVEGEPAPLSVESNLISQVVIYPNPTSDILNVRIPSSIEVTNVALFDLLGKNTGVSFSNNGTIDISNLSRGVYLLSLETTEGTLTQKVVKQ